MIRKHTEVSDCSDGTHHTRHHIVCHCHKQSNDNNGQIGTAIPRMEDGVCNRYRSGFFQQDCDYKDHNNTDHAKLDTSLPWLFHAPSSRARNIEQS